MFTGTPQHGPHRRQDLPELVVQLPRDMMQRRFAGGNQLLYELASLSRERRQLREETAIGPNQLKNRDAYREQCCREKQIDLSLNPVVDPLHALRGLFFVFVVLDEQSGDGAAQSRLTRL